MSGTSKQLWGWYPTDRIWIPLQVDDEGRVIVDMSGISLGDIGDVDTTGAVEGDMLYYDAASSTWILVRRANLANILAALTILTDLADVAVIAPGDGEALIWDAATTLWTPMALAPGIHTLAANTCIWREYTNRVSSTARTATVSSIAGDVITLTANEAYRFGDWGAAPEYMNAANVLLKIQNTTRSEFAWMKARPVANKIQVTVAADIAAWVNGDIVSTSKTGADSYAVELDISPLIPDGATAVFLAAQANDNGVISSGDGVRFSKEGAASTWNNVACQVSNFTIYGLQVCLLQANRHLNARDIASGVDTLQHAAFATMYIK